MTRKKSILKHPRRAKRNFHEKKLPEIKRKQKTCAFLCNLRKSTYKLKSFYKKGIIVKKTLIISAGGSGGHIVPASVLAKALKTNYKILFFTDKRGLRYKNMIPKNAKIISIPCSALGGKTKAKKLFALAWTFLGIIKTFFLFLYYKPVGVVGFAGYASFPSAIVAGILKKPLILHEQNTILGKTNRILSRFASAI